MLGFYFNPVGRISRKQFWLQYMLVLIVILICAYAADWFLFPASREASNGPVQAIANLVTLWPQIALTSKRFHDRGMTGWWQVLFNVAVGAGGYFAYSALLELGANPDSPDTSLLTPLLVGGGLVLIGGLAELVILGFLPGSKGSNKYGDDPLNPTGKVAEVFA